MHGGNRKVRSSAEKANEPAVSARFLNFFLCTHCSATHIRSVEARNFGEPVSPVSQSVHKLLIPIIIALFAAPVSADSGDVLTRMSRLTSAALAREGTEADACVKAVAESAAAIAQSGGASSATGQNQAATSQNSQGSQSSSGQSGSGSQIAQQLLSTLGGMLAQSMQQGKGQQNGGGGGGGGMGGGGCNGEGCRPFDKKVKQELKDGESKEDKDKKKEEDEEEKKKKEEKKKEQQEDPDVQKYNELKEDPELSSDYDGAPKNKLEQVNAEGNLENPAMQDPRVQESLNDLDTSLTDKVASGEMTPEQAADIYNLAEYGAGRTISQYQAAGNVENGIVTASDTIDAANAQLTDPEVTAKIGAQNQMDLVEQNMYHWTDPSSVQQGPYPNCATCAGEAKGYQLAADDLITNQTEVIKSGAFYSETTDSLVQINSNIAESASAQAWTPSSGELSYANQLNQTMIREISGDMSGGMTTQAAANSLNTMTGISTVESLDAVGGNSGFISQAQAGTATVAQGTVNTAGGLHAYQTQAYYSYNPTTGQVDAYVIGDNSWSPVNEAYYPAQQQYASSIGFPGGGGSAYTAGGASTAMGAATSAIGALAGLGAGSGSSQPTQQQQQQQQQPRPKPAITGEALAACTAAAQEAFASMSAREQIELVRICRTMVDSSSPDTPGYCTPVLARMQKPQRTRAETLFEKF